MMKKFLLLIPFALLFLSPAFGQISILVVDDSDDTFNHVEDFRNVLDSLGYAYALFNAQGTATVPTTQDLMGFDLVVWHAGSDSDSLAFWSFADTTNPALEAYLAAGGNMWVIGTDLLFDRYGGMASFAPGSFPFDYMGLQSYDVQSYIDDGNLGVPLVEEAPGSPVTGLPTLDWIFSTLWYVDGVTPINGGGLPVYEMGDNTYVFDGRTCGVWFDNGSSKVLSFFFNTSQISTYEKHRDMTAIVLDWFSSQIVGTNPAAVKEVNVYPNPATDQLSVRFNATEAGQGNIRVISVTGQEVFAAGMPVASGQQEFRLSTASLAAGMYLLELDLEGQTILKRFVKAD